MTRPAWATVLALGLLLAGPVQAAAYVGPGAGFVVLTSFLVVFLTGLLALFSMLMWPFRTAWRALRRTRQSKPRIRRLVIVGFDGQDPRLTDRFMREGKLPNLERLAADGCYHRLATTFPSVSPVAWSSFSTGTHPAKHNIYDFLDRDRRSYLPVLSSTRIGKTDRVLRVGRYRIPIGKPDLRLLRRSRPFWSILGDHSIWSTVLRVPITFPPDRFYGAQLSAMCVPDLLGTQGTFTLFSTRETSQEFKEGGRRVRLEGSGDSYTSSLVGPPNDLVDGAAPLELPLALELDRTEGVVRVEIGDQSLVLRPGELSNWVELKMRAAPLVSVRGICRMMVTEMEEHVSLYLTPLNIDPEKPAMPVSHPSYYAVYLAKKLGKFATLGLAEDTWALNEGVIDDGAFLEMTYDIDREREEMLFAALDKTRRGAVVCVFDATDRIQHMFWRYLEKGHPAAEGLDNPEHADAIAELYAHNDTMVGRIREKLSEDDLLIVLSDHGFSSFRRGVNLNAWLLENGYLVLREGRDGSSDWLRDVDWARTRAYALGLTGLFLNLEGREGEGIVAPGDEAVALRKELVEKLTGLTDGETGEVAIREAFATEELYAGPYLENAPDLLIGYDEGYRASWDGATGIVSAPLFENNRKAWSGDHCIDPRLVPGVLFIDRRIDLEDPSLLDIAPTALWLFGIGTPAHMDGRVLFTDDFSGSSSSAEVGEERAA